MKSILDPEFRYTPSVETDLRKTFARIRREQRRQQEALALAESETWKNVLPITSRRQEVLARSTAVAGRLPASSGTGP